MVKSSSFRLCTWGMSNKICLRKFLFVKIHYTAYIAVCTKEETGNIIVIILSIENEKCFLYGKFCCRPWSALPCCSYLLCQGCQGKEFVLFHSIFIMFLPRSSQNIKYLQDFIILFPVQIKHWHMLVMNNLAFRQLGVWRLAVFQSLISYCLDFSNADFTRIYLVRW